MTQTGVIGRLSEPDWTMAVNAKSLGQLAPSESGAATSSCEVDPAEADILSSPALMDQIRKSERDLAAGSAKVQPLDEMLKEFGYE